jgi:hypothetical protein
VAADVGKALGFRVTATKPGYSQLVRTATTQPVVDPSLVVANTSPPSITGTAAVGQVLSASSGTWTPADAALTRQWMRNGTAIAGRTGPTYTLVPADVGKRISVKVTGTKNGYQSGEATSAATDPVANGTITAVKPKVTGKTKVGKTLTAKAGTSTPSQTTVKYQWLRNGKAIKKATKVKYKLTKKDKGKKISVKVTRSAAGYDKLVLKSAQTKAIKG